VRKLGFALFAVLLLPLLGCRTKTDCRELGGAVGATWKDGPKVGVDASLGQHEVEVYPLSGGGAAAEGQPPVEAPRGKRFSDPEPPPVPPV